MSKIYGDISVSLYGNDFALNQLPTAKSWNSRTGYQLTYRYEGTREDCDSVALLAQAAGDAFTVYSSEDGGDARVEITYGAEETQSPTEPITDVWELDGNSLEKELWELPFVKTAMQSILYSVYGVALTGEKRNKALDQMRWVRTNVDKFINGTDKFTPYGTVDEIALDYKTLRQQLDQIMGSYSVAFDRLIPLYLRGVKAFPVPQYVLRRTRVIADNYQYDPSDEEVFVAIETSKLGTLKEKFTIPAFIKRKLKAGVWVKQTPKTMQMASRKWQISEEWYHADTAEFEIYGEVNTGKAATK